MILIYAYLQQYRNYRNAAISFDSRFNVSFTDGVLTIAPSSADLSALSYLRADKVDNLHVLVGKTGSGKTNLLQLIGEKYDKRSIEVWNSTDVSYFFLYWLGEDEFFLEICNVDIKQFPMEREPVDSGIPTQFKENALRLKAVRTVRFKLDRTNCRTVNRANKTKESDKTKKASGAVSKFTVIPEFGRYIAPISDPVRDKAIVLNAFDKHAFFKPIYDDERSLTQGESSGSWMCRLVVPYQKASLWSVCDCIREYLSDIEPGEDKKHVSFVLSTHNFAEKYPLKLSNALDKEYWTFWEKELDAQFMGVDEKAAKRYKKYQEYKTKKNLTNKQMFIHDLWTDYAKYLRKWVEKILSYNAEETIPEDYLDYSGTTDVYQEFVDYYAEKEYGEDFDPSELPDGKKISIVKRCIWLAEYIDRVDNRDPHGVLWQICDDLKDIGKFLDQIDNKYFITIDRFEIPVVDMALPEYKEIFLDLFERVEQYHPDDAGIFSAELLPYEFTCLSTGEYQYAKVLGAITDFLKISTRDPRTGKKITYDKIILLDEPEAYMHPELTRKFLSLLFKLTEKYTNEGTIQLIIGTHSPLLMSDVFPEEVTRLDIDKQTGCAIVKNGGAKEYYGANIHTILADSFFLEYTIGEESRKQLQEMFNRLKEIAAKDEAPDGRTGGTSAGNCSSDAEFIEIIRKIAPRIGDEFIRMAFEGQLRIIDDK